MQTFQTNFVSQFPIAAQRHGLRPESTQTLFVPKPSQPKIFEIWDDPGLIEPTSNNTAVFRVSVKNPVTQNLKYFFEFGALMMVSKFQPWLASSHW